MQFQMDIVILVLVIPATFEKNNNTNVLDSENGYLWNTKSALKTPVFLYF